MNNEAASRVINLLRDCKVNNKANKKVLIETALRQEGELCPNAHEIMSMLFSPLRVFNVKPKKDWKIGTDSPLIEWGTAHLVLLKLESRELSGNHAKDAAEKMLAALSYDHADLLLRILKKRPDAGMTANTINSVFPKYIPQFKASKAEMYDQAYAEWPMLAQPKMDGVRSLVHVDWDINDVTYYSYEGRKFTAFGHLTREALELAQVMRKRIDSLAEEKGVVLDTEAFGKDFKASVGSAKRKESDGNNDLHIFDYIPASVFFEADPKADTTPQLTRTKNLRDAMQEHFAVNRLNSAAGGDGESKLFFVPTLVVKSHEEAKKAFTKFQAEGHEGAVLKNPNSPYAYRKSRDWLKMKSEDAEDLIIVGYEEGTGKYEGMLGAIVVDYKGTLVSVGSGLTDKLRKEMWGKHDEWIGRIVEVEYMEVTPDGSLRHPRFSVNSLGELQYRDMPDQPGVKV